MIIAAVVAFSYWVAKIIAPKVLEEGEPPATRTQTTLFVIGVFLLWLVSDWPVHDISEEYLYSIHMIQHMVISLIVPPLFLLAIPEWLAKLVVSDDGESGIWIKRLCHPVTAGVIFNVVGALTHITWVVNTSLENGPFHYFVHLVVFFSGMLMWVPVFSPLKELRIGPAGQMLYLFANSVLPTIPGGFLAIADNAIYSGYDHPIRLWGVGVVADQQTAGLIMKLGGGFLIWGVIGVLFFRWVTQTSAKARPQSMMDDSATPLTTREVSEAFAKSSPAKREAPRR